MHCLFQKNLVVLRQRLELSIEDANVITVLVKTVLRYVGVKTVLRYVCVKIVLIYAYIKKNS